MLLNNRHIVVIDDADSILKFLRISLEALGAKFHGVATAAGGLALCETGKPDLVVLDLGLPDKEGLEILPRIKHLYKDHPIPVIVLTVRSEAEDREIAMKLGADAYITKPFIMSDLIEVMQVLLEKNKQVSRPSLIQKKLEMRNAIQGNSQSEDGTQNELEKC